VTPVELVCFHHAGGGSASFHPLRRALAALGDQLALTTVKLPERMPTVREDLRICQSYRPSGEGHCRVRRSNRSGSSPAATFWSVTRTRGW
jgi:surfactin synthase thioesterase subunit